MHTIKVGLINAEFHVEVSAGFILVFIIFLPDQRRQNMDGRH
jgi:hypothetical protein